MYYVQFILKPESVPPRAENTFKGKNVCNSSKFRLLMPHQLPLQYTARQMLIVNLSECPTRYFCFVCLYCHFLLFSIAFLFTYCVRKIFLIKIAK